MLSELLFYDSIIHQQTSNSWRVTLCGHKCESSKTLNNMKIHLNVTDKLSDIILGRNRVDHVSGLTICQGWPYIRVDHDMVNPDLRSTLISWSTLIFIFIRVDHKSGLTINQGWPRHGQPWFYGQPWLMVNTDFVGYHIFTPIFFLHPFFIFQFFYTNYLHQIFAKYSKFFWKIGVKKLV